MKAPQTVINIGEDQQRVVLTLATNGDDSPRASRCNQRQGSTSSDRTELGMNTTRAASILGLSPDASKEEIDERFRDLAKQTHPDLGGSEVSMSTLLEARDAMLDARRQESLPVPKDLELAIRTISVDARDQRIIENATREVRESVKRKATGKSRRWRNIALVFTVVSSGAIFLSKDMPLDSLMYPDLRPLSEDIPEPDPPTTKELLELTPGLSVEDSNRIQNRNIEIGKENEELLEAYAIELDYYKSELNRIKAHNQVLPEKNRDLQERRADVKRIWKLVLLMVAVYGGVGAFTFNKKIMDAEALLDEFKEYMLTRANTYSLVSEIMGDQIDDTWSIAEFAAKSESTDPEQWSLLHNAVGSERFSRLVLYSGLENGLLERDEGNVKNGYAETYKLASPDV